MQALKLIEDTVRRVLSEHELPTDNRAMAKILAAEVVATLTAAGLLVTTTSAAV